MATVNMPSIQVLVAKDAAGALKAAAQERADQVFADAVIGMQIEFEEHPVTQEIAGGVDATNISDTLAGEKYTPKNLYSFIGFSAADGVSPLEPIRDALDPSSSVGAVIGPRMRYVRKDRVGNNARFTFEVSAPIKEAVYKATPMPWATGWSWAQKIETVIPGFASFLARKMGHPSQSGGGIQAKDRAGNLIELRKGEYTPPEGGYLTTIFANFVNRIRGYAKGGLRKRFGQ